MPSFKVKEAETSQRVDAFVTSNIKELSRSFVNHLISDGKITVNKSSVKPSYKVKTGDKVRVDFNAGTHNKVPDIDLPVLYEDEDVIVIDKPSGILTHSKGSYNPEATVASYIKNKVSNMSGNRGGIVHRLDRHTSGVIITAKNPEALKWLQKQFSSRKTKKTYKAVVEGVLEPLEAIIDMPIERNPKRPQTFKVGAGGKPALTQYNVIKQNDTKCLVELRPKTGRTHQLRVHMTKQGHPVIGDELYGGQTAGRLYLHAESLELTLPNRERKVFTAKLPSSFKDILN